MIRNVKADLCGRSIFTFLRINYTALNSVFAGFQSTDREHEFSFFWQPWQHLVSVIFSFILTALIGVKWNLKMVLMVIHQTNKDVEYFKRYFLVILISLRNNLLRSITNVFIGSFVLKILFFLLLHIFMLSSVQPRTIFPSEKKENVSQIKLGLYMQL